LEDKNNPSMEYDSNKYTENDIKYFQEFANTISNMQSAGYFLNPLLLNQGLKNINMHPTFKNKDTVEKMVFNPNEHEMGLRRLSQYLYNTQTPYKRLIHGFVDALDFDWYPIPMNATREDMNKTQFKSDYKRMFDWTDKFNIKKEFKKALLSMFIQDAKFTYLRESPDKNHLTLQELPIDYCTIDSTSHLGYLYSFNLMYFQDTSVDINGFDNDFKEFNNDMLDMQKNKTYYPNIKPEMRDGRWAYWQQLSPEKAWCFKFHDSFATLIPPFLGLFIDAIGLEEVKKLEKSKEVLDTYKMIFGSIPRNKDSDKSGRKRDNFAIDPTTLGDYMKFVKNSLPEGIDFKAAPLEDVKMFEFASKANPESIGIAIKNFYKESGAELSLFGSDKPNASTLNASIQMDMNFVESVYEQFATFCEYHINKGKKYKFKIKMMGTSFDRKQRREDALEEWQNGIMTPRLPASLGMTVRDFENSLNMMDMLNIHDKLKPIKTSHTMGKEGDGKDGRTKKDDNDLSDSGEATRDTDGNEE
jgi:hypothetical protein